MRSYRQDAEVFIETHKRFDIPVSTGIISIRYYQIMNILTEEQQHHLIKRLSDILSRVLEIMTLFTVLMV